MRQRKSRAASGGVRSRDFQEELSLDQLPGRLRAAIRSIRSDNRSGALALARHAAGALLALAEDRERAADCRFHSTLELAARELVAAQPAMAPLFHIANAAVLAAENRAEAVARARVRQACRRFLRRLDEAGPRISRHAAQLIRAGSVILTHSASETVLHALLAAWDLGKRFEVVCTESRPVCEGRTMAARLASRGIPVTLIVDAAAFLHLNRASLVLVGADSVSTQGLVNKVGTSLVAAGARETGKPIYALCDSTKLLPAGHLLPPEPPRPAREVLPRRMRNVAVSNLYFDLTPLDWLTGVVTEEGILTPGRLNVRLRRISAHPALARSVRPSA